jgi:hypothetical protein
MNLSQMLITFIMILPGYFVSASITEISLYQEVVLNLNFAVEYFNY